MGVGYGYVSDFIVVNLYFLVMNNKFEIGMKVDLEVIFKIQFYCLLYFWSGCVKMIRVSYVCFFILRKKYGRYI